MEWWKKSVVYQVYPRSFKDTDGDGIGDIKGVTEKLDYLKDLGIDVIWLSPVFESPQDDNGYDISDYRKIWSTFGTNEDMYELIEEAHNRDIKIVMDLVANHSSDEHDWFVESKKSKDNPYRDYYFWRDEPNNWGSFFSGSAWEYDENTEQYYLHLFTKKQPDLNWENPKVRQEVWDLMKFWMDKGVDGWRLDVISSISKHTDFPDYDEKYGKYPIGDFHTNGPRLHEYLQEMNREVLSKYDCMTVGEAPGSTPENALLFCGNDRNELNMIFTFDHMSLDLVPNSHLGKWEVKDLDLIELKDNLNTWQNGLHRKGWNSLYFENHDQPRIVSRWGNDDKYRVESAKMFATILHMMQGTPYIYQGEEIGMINAKFEIEEYDDVEIRNAYKDLVLDRKMVEKDKFMEAVYRIGRDNARTPMQWSSDDNAGFTTGKPWLKLNPSYKEINVASALNDENSVFYHYKELIKIRHEDDVVTLADFRLVDRENKSVFAYERRLDDKSILVVANFYEDDVDFELAGEYRLDEYSVLLSNYKEFEKEGNKIKLKPFEAIVLKNY
ncbi:MAG: alpha-glucosidase [Peptostreptococcus porci]|uniref:Alpha-glucosidase n=1 Tax=Peptostreptococcus porci TaxID=2652282 RepID=A0A6N7XHB2_9FIRM|nr:alpha-glucosidase [Peptostreptococcus porci]MDD7183959.1 alpha-glucosidase [Peptostreptococcus porci]MDY2794356.1 alpha-glucosidase [Peptostreptococcus porci]MDY5478987.1 alpha-glucosidase [Peptostreptococcus porci]MST62993.1 alpha-glucosidase [Peptostreptococcus porci]